MSRHDPSVDVVIRLSLPMALCYEVSESYKGLYPATDYSTRNI